MEKKEILALAPADHWFAVYRNDDGSRVAEHLAVWAVVSDEVRGMIADLGGLRALEDAAAAVNFVCFAHETELDEALAEGKPKA